MYHARRGKGFFLPWLTFHFWAEKRGFFFLLKACLAKKKKGTFGFCSMLICLGEPRYA